MARCTLHKMVDEQVFTAEKLEKIEFISNMYSYAPIKSALNFGFLIRKDYVSFLRKEGYPLVDVRTEEIDESYIDQCDIQHLNSFLYIPLRKEIDGCLLVAAADPFDEKLYNSLFVKFKMQIRLVAASDLDITWLAHKLRGGFYVKEAVFSLMRKDAANSGLITFTDAQLIFIFSFIAINIILLILYFAPTVTFINLFSSIFFLFSIVFKLFLALRGSMSELHEAVSKEDIKRVDVDTLPVYTILLPVYKEDKLIRKLIWNLRSLDYPKEKLDVKL